MLAWLARHGAKLPRLCRDDDGWLLYLALWTLMTLLFFTMSGNIIFPYSLPMLPGCALLFAELWRRARGGDAKSSALPWIAAVGGVVLLALLAFNHYDGNRYLRTQKQVIATWQAQDPSADSALVYWAGRREFSAEFYSQGRALPRWTRSNCAPGWPANPAASSSATPAILSERPPTSAPALPSAPASTSWATPCCCWPTPRRLRRSRANEMSDAFVPLPARPARARAPGRSAGLLHRAGL